MAEFFIDSGAEVTEVLELMELMFGYAYSGEDLHLTTAVWNFEAFDYVLSRNEPDVSDLDKALVSAIFASPEREPSLLGIGFALEKSCLKGNFDVVECLLETFEPTEAQWKECLSNAKLGGNLWLVKYLKSVHKYPSS
jgi:hypothetical protein